MFKQQSDLPPHSVLLAIVPFHRPHDFLLVFRCNYVSNLHDFRDIIDYFPKLKDVT